MSFQTQSELLLLINCTSCDHTETLVFRENFCGPMVRAGPALLPLRGRHLGGGLESQVRFAEAPGPSVYVLSSFS